MGRNRKIEGVIDTPQKNLQKQLKYINRTFRKVIDNIIRENIIHFRLSTLENPGYTDFSVKCAYGYGCFDLCHVEGWYYQSIYSLFHYVLYQEKYYAKLLSKRQYGELIHLIQEDPHALYMPSLEDGDIDYGLLSIFDEAMHQGILYTGKRLQEEGFTLGKELQDYLTSS